MADDLSTSTDEAVDASVDTSVSDDNTTDNDDVDLEDIEVDIADISDNDDEEEQSESTDESEADEPSEDESDEESEEAELSDEQTQAQHNKEMFERRQQEKEARIARIKQDQATYIAEASVNRDPLELAVRQLQVTEYNNTVERVTNTVTNQYERALNDFEVLRTDDPVIQAEIDSAIDSFQAMHVTVDQYGNATDVRGDLYATLQAKADAITKLTGIRASRQEKSKTKEKSKAFSPTSRAPREPKKDAAMEAFDEEADW